MFANCRLITLIILSCVCISTSISANAEEYGIIENQPKNIIGALTVESLDYQLLNATFADIQLNEIVDAIESPIYDYIAVSQGNGIYSLTQDGFNKQAFRGQIATSATYYNQLIVNNMLFDHIYLDSHELSAKGKANQYAAVMPQFAPYQFTKNEGALWFRSYSVLERLFFTEDIDVNNTAYGQIVGADFTPVDLKDGWKFLPTTYIAYNGGRQSFDDVNMYQNGGQGGFMGTFSKGHFIGAILAYGGGYHNEMSVEGNTDTTGNWFAGVAAKTAYNFRPSKHLIIQPTVLAAYDVFGGQNWTSDFGAISMNSGLLNGLNVAPGLNLIYGRETWSAYLTTQYMYKINDKISGNAGGVELPDLSMTHGYLVYGAGITKTWKERFMSFIQVTMHNGGRTGVGFVVGLDYKL